MSDTYYVVKKFILDEDTWDELATITVYLYGKSSYYDWTSDEDKARKFKSIKEIRTI